VDWQLHCLLALVALCGTDYSRSFPLVGAKRVWQMLNVLLPILTTQCLRLDNGVPLLDPDLTATQLYGAVYSNAFAAHARGALDLSSVQQRMSKSKLSERTKAAVPSAARAHCTARNANFVMAYWLGLDVDSMAPHFGFRESGGVVEFDD